MPFCPECRQVVDEALKACPFCGVAMLPENSAAPFLGAAVNGKHRVEALMGRGGRGGLFRARPKRASAIAILAILFVLLGAAGGLAITFLAKKAVAARRGNPDTIAPAQRVLAK